MKLHKCVDYKFVFYIGIYCYSFIYESITESVYFPANQKSTSFKYNCSVALDGCKSVRSTVNWGIGQ